MYYICIIDVYMYYIYIYTYTYAQCMSTPTSDHHNFTQHVFVQGLGGPGTFCLIGNAVRLSEGWAR